MREMVRRIVKNKKNGSYEINKEKIVKENRLNK